MSIALLHRIKALEQQIAQDRERLAALERRCEDLERERNERRTITLKDRKSA